MPSTTRSGDAVRTLVTPAGERSEVSVDDVRRLLADGGGPAGFWLDIERPEEADYDLLLNGFHFHPLTVEDVRVQNQRPKLDHFNGYKFAVLFTAERRSADELAFQEHHLYLCERWLVTVHHGPAPVLEEVRGRVGGSPDLTRDQLGFLEYLVINGLVESLFPVLDQLDETIDDLEDRIVEAGGSDLLGRLTDLKHSVTDLRRVVGPQRDVFQRLLTHSLEHASGELSLYWRDVYEHLVRQYESVDSLRDLLTGAMDVYLSTVSNRLNSTMKQLTVIASVFLPLSFLTGFFGMNFGFLVGKITGVEAFTLGIVLMAGTLVVQLYLFRRRGWI